jgi:NitT/TauT family transport system permease protein
VLILAVILAVWQLVGSGSVTEGLTVSTPWAVLGWIVKWASGDEFHGWADLGATMEEAILGYLLGVAIGVVLAAFVSVLPPLRILLAPLMSVLNALPKVALAPLFIVIFGSSLSSKTYFVTSTIFLISFFNVSNGIKSIDQMLIRNAQLLGANWLWLVWEVYIPAIIGWLVTSLRLTAAWALASAVIAEYLSAQIGMGFIVASGQQTADATVVIGGIVIVSLVALIIDQSLKGAESRFSRWKVDR